MEALEDAVLLAGSETEEAVHPVSKSTTGWGEDFLELVAVRCDEGESPESMAMRLEEHVFVDEEAADLLG